MKRPLLTLISLLLIAMPAIGALCPSCSIGPCQARDMEHGIEEMAAHAEEAETDGQAVTPQGNNAPAEPPCHAGLRTAQGHDSETAPVREPVKETPSADRPCHESSDPGTNSTAGAELDCCVDAAPAQTEMLAQSPPRPNDSPAASSEEPGLDRSLIALSQPQAPLRPPPVSATPPRLIKSVWII